MKVAVTGGSGFIGRNFVEYLSKESDMAPIIISRNNNIDSHFECRITDYTYESLKEVLKDIGCLVHLAATRGVEYDFELFNTNTKVTDRIFKTCAELGIKNIVFASSISVYSDVSNIPWKETQKVYPKTLYGISKISCEYIAELYHKNHGLNVKSLRIAHVFGKAKKDKFMMSTFLDRAAEGKPLKVIGKSIAKREYIYVDDVSKAIYYALKKRDIYGAFNIGTGLGHTNLEIAKIVNDSFNNNGKIIYMDGHEETIESSIMSVEKARSILGYEADYTLQKAFKKIQQGAQL